MERDRANKERQEIEKRQRLQEQENKRLEREKQREMEEERALNLNKSGSWAPETMAGGVAGGGGAPHRAAPTSTPSPNAAHHAVSQNNDVPHPPAVSDRDALRKLEAEKRRKQANQNPIDMNQQSQIMSMFEDML